ncbi:MAG: peptide ABC transporter substrate-binding protein [Thermoleophilia bacterium]|nr:peptide ABC transporter substrate-binding protein [Thermoleophilia bacterium]
MRKRWLWPAALVASLLLAVAGCGGDDEDGAGDTGGETAAEQVITVNWGTEPPSLDPGLASDTTSANILLNIMDPLVKLDDDLEPVPTAAESWEVSDDGTTYTFTLRDDLAWTNGDPVTAEDFAYSWKRTISPELGADYAYQFFGIQGASDYNGCEENCDAMADEVGVRAVDERTLEVTLTSPQPWFLQQLAHHSFLAVHRPTVEQFGDTWTEASNIVTNGPFRLARWEHDSRIDLVKWEEWRDADSVTLTRVNGRMISDGTTAVQAFEAGEIDAQVGGLPPQEMQRLKTLPEYQQYPALGTYYYGFNVENITDPNQRRAMAVAINRRAIIDNVAQADQLPATGYTPEGTPGFDTLNPESEWLPEEGDIDRAKELMDQVQNPKTNINLFHNDAPGHREIAVAVQDMWKELGLNVTIRAQEWAQYLEFIGPPPSGDVDVFRLGWIGDFVDAINFLEMWTCRSGNNSTNYCDENYDRIVEEVQTGNLEEDERFDRYAELEQMLFGSDGAVPLIPIYWYTYVNLERENIQETFNLNLLDQVDLTTVEVQE